MSSIKPAPEFDDLMNQVKVERSEESFHQLFNSFFGKVLSYLKQSGIEHQKSYELAQEVFINIWHKADFFDSSKGSFQVWLFTIVRNLKFDHFRSQKKDVLTLSSEDIYELGDEISDDLGADLLDLNQEVRKCVSHLPTEQRDAVEAIYFEGYTHSEYAERKNVPLGTVKSRVRLALVQLKKRMEEQ